MHFNLGYFTGRDKDSERLKSMAHLPKPLLGSNNLTPTLN